MAIEFYSSIDLNNNELQNAIVQNVTSDPTGTNVGAGQLVYRTDTNELKVHTGSGFVALSTTTGDITGVTAGNGLTGGGSSGGVTLTVGAGDGITVNSNDVAVTAAQTTITSILATDLKIGEDDQTKIDFEDANQINFYANNAKEMVLAANALTPGTSDGTALGTGSLMWSDLFLASGGVINFNNGDIALTHSSNKLTLTGGTFSAPIAADDITITDGANFVDSSDNTVIGFADNALTLGAANTSVSGNLNVAADIIHTGDTNNKISFGTDTQTFTTGGTARLTIVDASTTIANPAIFSDTISVDGEINHTGDTNNSIAFGTDTQTFSTGGSSRLDLSDSGVRFGGTGARITQVEDNDSLGTSDTKLATQGNVKAYVDERTGTNITSLGVISQDSVIFTSANANDPLVVIKNTTNDANGARLKFLKDKGAAAADNDEIGEILFAGDDAAQAETDFGKIVVQINEADNTDEAGKMSLQVASSDGTTTGLTSGLVLTGHKTSDYVDVTLGSGASSTVTIPGDLTVVGTQTVNNVVTVSTSNGVQFEGTAADGNDAILKSAVASSDKTYTLPNITGHIPILSNDPGTTAVSATVAELNIMDGVTATTSELNIMDGVTATTSELNILDGVTSTATELNLLDGITTLSGSNTGDEPDASTSVKGIVELATDAEVKAGSGASKVVDATQLAAQRSVVCDIDVSSLTDQNIVTITHNLGTADIIVQVYDKTTEANIMCDIARTTDDFSTASTSVVSIDFGTAPPNDCRALITSLAGATAGSIAYT